MYNGNKLLIYKKQRPNSARTNEARKWENDKLIDHFNQMTIDLKSIVSFLLLSPHVIDLLLIVKISWIYWIMNGSNQCSIVKPWWFIGLWDFFDKFQMKRYFFMAWSKRWKFFFLLFFDLLKHQFCYQRFLILKNFSLILLGELGL